MYAPFSENRAYRSPQYGAPFHSVPVPGGRGSGIYYTTPSPTAVLEPHKHPFSPSHGNASYSRMHNASDVPVSITSGRTDAHGAPHRRANGEGATTFGYGPANGNGTGSSVASDDDESSNSSPSQSHDDGGNASTIEHGPFHPPLFDREQARRKHQLLVCQQPLRARMCGFGEKDRRPIDPPPIVQLIMCDEDGNQDNTNLSLLHDPLFVLHVALWSEDAKEDRNIISNPPKQTRVLMGSLVASPALLKNVEGDQGVYFCFPDLSIRTEGIFTLKFSLMKLGAEPRCPIVATTFSEPFTVYSAKKFPGMTESTELSKTFAKQGLKIPIRNDVRPKKMSDD